MDDDIIAVGSPIPRIQEVQALSNREVQVIWRSGTVQLCDLAPALASRRVFLSLRHDDTLFHSLRPNEEGTAIVWNNGAELSAEWLERLAVPEFSNADFRNMMYELGLSLDGMAASLDLSRRLIASYRKNKPIPRHIAYATLYLVTANQMRDHH